MKVSASSAQNETGTTGWAEVVRQQVESLHFGVVQIVIHESRVVQIERTEKVRFGQKPATERTPASPTER